MFAIAQLKNEMYERARKTQQQNTLETRCGKVFLTLKMYLGISTKRNSHSISKINALEPRTKTAERTHLT